ncbi:MAG TPA: transcriptional regulator NrdR [Myxococcota bacterium]|nr:transcriptional regulator NrdR [Myxococcota bacterium]HRY94886.1 transcriptional regulator NrdR [Myxococcota bacterium]HSA22671.1 transcriptional regulator NrdR [Myxococcota bacterium]
MKCPFCDHLQNRVIDSRLSKDGHAIRRRRECDLCARRFTTYERVETITPMVIKKDGRREPFDREKLKSGIRIACQKRPVSVNTIDQFVDELERRVLESGDREVTSQVLGEDVMRFLQATDDVAYVRFASVYRSFKDLKEFMSELQDLVQPSRPRKGERK